MIRYQIVLLQSVINRSDQQLRQNNVQSGGTLTNSDSTTDPSGNTMRTSADLPGNNDAERASTSHTETPSDTAQPSDSAAPNNHEPRPSDATEPSQINIDALIRHGGILNGYYVNA